MRLLIVGAGGHAKVVLDAALCCGMRIAGVIGAPSGVTELLGVPVEHGANDLARFSADAFIVGIGNNTARAEEFARLCELGLKPVSVIHPSAVVAASAVIGAGTFVAAGAIVNPEATIGVNAILNTGCTVDHDCVVGDHALIGPTASLCGAARVDTGALVGAGASVVPAACVGAWSVIGAGGAVAGDIPPHSVAVGVPATVIKRIED